MLHLLKDFTPTLVTHLSSGFFSFLCFFTLPLFQFVLGRCGSIYVIVCQIVCNVLPQSAQKSKISYAQQK